MGEWSYDNLATLPDILAHVRAQGRRKDRELQAAEV